MKMKHHRKLLVSLFVFFVIVPVSSHPENGIHQYCTDAGYAPAGTEELSVQEEEPLQPASYNAGREGF